MKQEITMFQKVEEYLSYRHDLGYQLKIEGSQLRRFACYSDSTDHVGPLTTELVLAWVSSRMESTRYCRARKLEVIRPFARYLASLEPGTEIPPKRFFGSAHRRTQPYIFQDGEITALIEAACHLVPIEGIRPRTYATLIGLMAATGLRTCEALKLEQSDIDLDRGLMTIRESKFHHSRLVPLHSSTVAALATYICKRDTYFQDPVATSFFLSEQGRSLLPSIVHFTFQKLRRLTGISENHIGRLPRLYDLRHTFATKRLLQWYREGIDVNHAIALLSTYMGHVKVTDTYWYLSGVPDLFALVGNRFEAATHCNDQEECHD